MEMTTDEAAVALGVTAPRIRQLCAAGVLSARRIGRRLLLIDAKSVEAYAINRRPVGWPRKERADGSA